MEGEHTTAFSVSGPGSIDPRWERKFLSVKCLWLRQPIRQHENSAPGPANNHRFPDQKERRQGNGFRDRSGSPVLLDVRGLSRLQRHPVRAGRGTGRRAAHRPALVAPMFTGLFMDKMVGFVKTLLPGLPARRSVRQGHRTVGLFQVHRRLGHRPGRRASAPCCRSCGLRDPDLWRRFAVRGGVCGLSVRRRNVPRRATYRSG